MIDVLNWDSAFFNCRVGRHEVGSAWNETGFKVSAQMFDIVYVFSEQPLNIACSFSDSKEVFVKRVQHYEYDKSIISDFSKELINNNSFLDLVYLSGHKSRFKRDAFFGERKFRALYRAWIKKNLIQPNEYILVKKVGQMLAGFVSFSVIDNNNATIELIAVHSNFQGKGVGRSLLQAVENSLPPSSNLTVSTQGANPGACLFYEGYGFRKKLTQYIYHYEPDSIQ